MHLEQKVSLKEFHTFRTEATARYFVNAGSRKDLHTLMNYRNMIRMPILILGGGSNLLFRDDFPGIVVRVSSRGISLLQEDDHHVKVCVEAGEPWDGFVDYCVSRGWGGLENLSLIPGTAGAAPIQNIGAYGVEAGELIESVLGLDIDTGREIAWSREECRFGYRDSLFKREMAGKVIILAVTFRLWKAQPDQPHPNIRTGYGGIRAELERMQAGNPGMKQVREAVCRIRASKLPDPAVLPNAGSFFKNPVVPASKAEPLIAGWPEMPTFAHGADFKLSAAWLIEQCGWKGFRDGDAGVSPGHALVLVNYGKAGGREIYELSGKIIASVEERFGVRLEREVNCLP